MPAFKMTVLKAKQQYYRWGKLYFQWSQKRFPIDNIKAVIFASTDVSG